MHHFANSRESFEAARAAAIDAAKARPRLAAIEGKGKPARTANAGEDFMAAQLKRRLDADERAIDSACAILEQLAPVCPWWVIDALTLHYLEGRTWEQVADAVGYSPRHVQRQVAAALALADRMEAGEA